MYGRILLFCLRPGGVGSQRTAPPISSDAIRRERSSIRMLKLRRENRFGPVPKLLRIQSSSQTNLNLGEGLGELLR